MPNRTNAIGFGSSNDDKANFNMIFARQKMEYNMYYVQEIVIKASKKAFLKMCKTSESNILVTNMISMTNAKCPCATTSFVTEA